MTLDRVFHNRTADPVPDAYGYPVPVGGSRVRVGDCRCPVPCQSFRCVDCKQQCPWCCGGAPDRRCDHCVTGIEPSGGKGRE